MVNNTIRVLLLEDDPEDANLIIEQMQKGDARQSFFIQKAANLSEAMAIMEQVRFDVGLIDLMLPDSVGLETFHRIREAKPDLPLVILSGMRDESLADRAVGEGAQDYLIKGSIDARTLRRALRYAIERARLTSHLQIVIDKSADAMVVIDTWGVVRYANPASAGLFGRRTEDMVGRPFKYRVPPNETSEITLPDGAGGTRTAQVRSVEIEWKGVASSLASIRDVTHLQRLEQLKAEIRERRKTEQMKDLFLHAASHELRSPLSVIKAVISNLKEGVRGPLNADQLMQVQMADRNAIRLNKIIGNLLELSRLESGGANMNMIRIDLGEILREMAESFKMTPEGSRFKLDIDIEAGLPVVEADPDMMVQVFRNLLDNASRFARNGIRIAARSLSSDASAKALGRPANDGLITPCVEIVVSDDGVGIPESRIGELFNKFVQINRPVGGSQYKGTGLGLAICREIMIRHQGRIWAENPPDAEIPGLNGSNAGARFHLALPQIQDHTLAENEGRFFGAGAGLGYARAPRMDVE